VCRKEIERQKKEHEDTNDIMEKKATAIQTKYDELVLARTKEKRVHEGSDERYKKLGQKYRALQQDMQSLTLKMEEQEALEAEAFDIRHAKERGKPLKDHFVRHCRCLLATGSSARSVREQLLLNGAFFLGAAAYAAFMEAMPELRWFNAQREGMGYESLLYSFVTIAKCDAVVQWGFDETGLDGVPTLNQWCRIQEGDAYRNVTIECAGLLTGSTSTRVAEHVKVLWARGQEAVQMLREDLGAEADALVPMVNGGVTMTKLRGVMHDTCNSANLIAKKVRIIRDDIGEDMYGKEEWANMQLLGSGWQDFLCANHSRNLHFDAFSRGFTALVKQQLGDGLAAAKLRSGGRLRIEPDGEAFLRSICKLTHVGPKQYAKGDA